MTRNLIIGGAAALALILVIVGFVVFRPAAAPSGAITAAPLVVAAPTEAPVAAIPAAPAATAVAAPTAVPSEAPVAAAATAVPSEVPTAPASAPRIFEIVQAESQARFLIDEVLRGAPITVVGSTDQVAGQIAINADDPAQTQVGVIQINARALTTDNDFRNRAISNAILQTDRYELISFTPTELQGLPAQVNIGEPFSFQILGELTIREVTRPVTFELSVTPLSADEISGLATTSVLYRDFALNIPEVPSVDLVADEVRLELEFVARASS
jgi:polyisoprenoid-binding protein YceI